MTDDPLALEKSRPLSPAAMQHEINWTPERIGRFWDYLASTPGFEQLYFTRQVGADLIRYVAKAIRIGTVVDIGCGRGDLLKILLAKEYEAYGADQSAASVAEVNQRFAGDPCFQGAVVGTALPDHVADTAFMIEVVEHMDDEALDQALAEAQRLLKPGGHLVVTTPNDEDLQDAKRMCPECGAVFHQMQHVRSWTAATFTARAAKFSFEPVRAEAILLTRYSGALRLAHKLRYLGRKRPHLVYVGVKR